MILPTWYPDEYKSKYMEMYYIARYIGRNKVFLHNKARLTESTKVTIYELYRVIEYEIIFLDSDTEKQTKKRKQRK